MMIYFILILGIILVVISWKDSVLKWRQEDEELDYLAELGIAEFQIPTAGQEDDKEDKTVILDNIKSIEHKLDYINDSFNEILLSAIKNKEEEKSLQEDKISKAEKSPKENSPKEKNYQEIYAAYQKGKDVTELAKEFKKGKGEIELILNMFR